MRLHLLYRFKSWSIFNTVGFVFDGGVACFARGRGRQGYSALRSFYSGRRLQVYQEAHLVGQGRTPLRFDWWILSSRVNIYLYYFNTWCMLNCWVKYIVFCTASRVTVSRVRWNIFLYRYACNRLSCAVKYIVLCTASRVTVSRVRCGACRLPCFFLSGGRSRAYDSGGVRLSRY